MAQLVNGYQFGISDAAIYVPTVEHIVRPGLFPTDYLFSVPFENYAFWFPAVAALARVFSVETVFFCGHLTAQLALFWSIYHLSFALFRGRGAAALAVLLLVVPKAIGGTWNDTHDTYFVARDLAIPLALGSLIPFYRGRLVLAGVLAAATFLLHPVTGLSVVGVVVLSAILDRTRYPRGTPPAAVGVMLLCIVPLLLRVLGSEHEPVSNGNFLAPAAPDWLKVIKSRLPYLFVTTWNSVETLSAAAYLTILVGSLLVRWWQRRSQPRETGDSNSEGMARLPEVERSWHAFRVDLATSRVVLVCVGLLACDVIFAEWYPLPVVLELSLLRGLHLIVILATIYAAGMLWEGSRHFWRVARTKPGPGVHLILGLLMGSVIPLLFALVFMGNSARLVVLGTIPFLWWIAVLGSSQQSTAQTRALGSSAWLIGGAFLLGLILIFLHEFRVLGEQGVLGGAAVAAVTVVAGLGELARRVVGQRASPMPELGGNALVVGVAILFLFTNRGALLRTLTAQHFAERLAIPGVPPSMDWKFPGNLPYNDYIDVGRWCKANTQPDAVFLVPPRLDGFRVYSQRGIVGDWKDGAQSTHSRQFALAWWQRMAELDGYDSFDEARLIELGSQFGAAFAVMRRSKRLALPVVYENGGLVVYSLVVRN